MSADLRELSDQALAERLKCEEPNYPLCNEAARRLSARGWQPMESAPKDGVRFDPETGTWVARYTILTAARSEQEAHQALAGAVRLAAEAWPLPSPPEDTPDAR